MGQRDSDEDYINEIKEESYELRAKLKPYVSYVRKTQRGREGSRSAGVREKSWNQDRIPDL